MEETIVETNSSFLQDVISGLSKPVKKLSSKYFYDEKGDKLFQQIMQLDSYYLPEAELEILRTQALNMMEGYGHREFDLIELGAGDGRKTVYFIEKLLAAGKQVTYKPLDISADVLKTNKVVMQARLPQLDIQPIAGDYFKTLSTIDKSRPKILLFMGSNIGNYEGTAAIDFLKQIRQYMQSEDRILVAFDLKKNPKIILNAYNDSEGITRQFNLNLLERINRELGADFDIAAFDHYPAYDPLTGITYSFLVSLKEQYVRLNGQLFEFQNGEIIHTEVSQKYDLKQIEDMRSAVGFNSVKHFLDTKAYYAISVFEY